MFFFSLFFLKSLNNSVESDLDEWKPFYRKLNESIKKNKSMFLENNSTLIHNHKIENSSSILVSPNLKFTHSTIKLFN